jgi:hypothetical protein
MACSGEGIVLGGDPSETGFGGSMRRKTAFGIFTLPRCRRLPAKRPRSSSPP